MKPISFSIIVGLGLMAGLKMAQAQSEEVATPTPPYIAAVPDYGHWMVTFKYEASPPAATPTPPPAPAKPPTPGAPAGADATATAATTDDGSPLSIETIKTGDLRGVTLTFASGKSKQYTCQGDWVLCSTPSGPQLGIATPMAHPYMFYSPGFILLDGVVINLSTYRETKLHNGVMSFHYKSGTEDIWIDPATMLPLAVKKDGVEVSYQFLTPPPRPFPIPKDQADLLQKEQQAYKATSSMR